MPLAMNREVFITCAVTGAGGTQDRSPHVPRSPAQIAESAIAAAKAGAAVVHCHVRDPETGAPARDPALYRELTERIRDSATDVVLNLTAGMGGDLLFDGTEAMGRMSQRSDMAGAAERVAHVVDCRPEICTLDCGTMNFAEADYVMVNTPGLLRDMAARMTASGVQIEIEAFDTGHLWFARQLVSEGIIRDPVLVQLCMGVPWGRPMTSTPSWRWSTTCPPAGTGRPLPSGATRCPMSRPRCSRGGTCAWGSRTTSGSIAGCSRPTRNSSNARAASSRAWAPASSPPPRCARASA